MRAGAAGVGAFVRSMRSHLCPRDDPEEMLVLAAANVAGRVSKAFSYC